MSFVPTAKAFDYRSEQEDHVSVEEGSRVVHGRVGKVAAAKAGGVWRVQRGIENVVTLRASSRESAVQSTGSTKA